MSTYSQIQVGHRLRDERKARGLRQFDVAEALGVTNDTVCAWETGRKSIKAKSLYDYLMFLADHSNADCDVLSIDEITGFRPVRKPVEPNGTIYLNAAEAILLDLEQEESEQEYEKELG